MQRGANGSNEVAQGVKMAVVAVVAAVLTAASVIGAGRMLSPDASTAFAQSGDVITVSTR